MDREPVYRESHILTSHTSTRVTRPHESHVRTSHTSTRVTRHGRPPCRLSTSLSRQFGHGPCKSELPSAEDKTWMAGTEAGHDGWCVALRRFWVPTSQRPTSTTSPPPRTRRAAPAASDSLPF